MDGRRSGPIDGMKWQVRCKQKKFGKLQVVLICFKLGGRESDQSRDEVQACRIFFLGQIATQSDVSRSNREQRWKQRLTEPSR